MTGLGSVHLLFRLTCTNFQTRQLPAHGEKQASIKARRQVDSHANRQAGRLHLPDCYGVSLTLPHSAVNGKMISLLQTPLTSSADVRPGRELTSVQLYLSGANIAWHEKGVVTQLSFLNRIVFLLCHAAWRCTLKTWPEEEENKHITWDCFHPVCSSLTSKFSKLFVFSSKYF